jgi:hypothetical protein
MKLPDFLSFEAFNRLRQEMGASELGHFDFFDPKLQLSTREREDLAKVGLSVSAEALRELEDLSLAFKDGRVLVYAHLESDTFHLSQCDRLRQLQASGGVVILATQTLGEAKVCGDCLQRLHYKGFDMIRNRHRQYSENIRARFSSAEYFTMFPSYPIKTQTSVDPSHQW